MSDVTRILNAMGDANPKAAEEFFPSVYDESPKLAAHKLAAEQPGPTLQPSALLHEARPRLAWDPGAMFQNRGHFRGGCRGDAADSELTGRGRNRCSKRGAGSGTGESGGDRGRRRGHLQSGRAILHPLPTGRSPIQAESPVEILRQVLDAGPVRPALINAGVNLDLEIICLKCLEKSPVLRYGSASGIGRGLRLLARP